MTGTNQYQDFANSFRRVQELAQTAQQVYQSPNPSRAAQDLAASLFNSEETQAYRGHLLQGNPSADEIYNVLAEGTNQANEHAEQIRNDNLEGILRDAPKKLRDFAAKNVKPAMIGNENHDRIAKCHEAYREAAELWQNYKVPETRKEAREKLLTAVDNVYDQRYTDDNEMAELMKDLARFSDHVLMDEYSNIVKSRGRKFEEALAGNEISYLFENASQLDNNEAFMGYLLTGNPEHLVKSARNNDDESGAGAMEEEMQMAAMAQASSPEEARQIMLRNYEMNQAQAEGDFAVSRNAGIQAAAPSILTGMAA